MNPNSGFRSIIATLALLAAALVAPAPPVAAGQVSGAAPLSPSAIVAAPDGRTVYVACATGDRVLAVDLPGRSVVRSIASLPAPSGLALSPEGETLFVTCAAPESTVRIVDVATGRITGRIPAGHTALAPVLSPDGRTLFLCNRFNDDVSVIDLVAKREVRRIPVRREPVAAALTPDGRHLLVANHLPAGRADAGHVGAVITVIDTARAEAVRDLALPGGSGALQEVRMAPDGRTAVVSHVLARFQPPTTQVERGWMNTAAKTIIDLANLEVKATVLLDSVDRGAANPWAMAWSADGRTLVVTHAGTHEVNVIDYPAELTKLEAIPPARASAKAISPNSAGTASSRMTAVLENDLSFLTGLRERRSLPEGDLGPRGVVVVGRVACVANYFSDTLSLIDLDAPGSVPESVRLGPAPHMTAARRGELYFNDARLCFQGWQSCASCHPGDGRVDGLNWDLLNDGMGNPKNSKSLLFVFETPPAMSTGVRESAYAAVRAGIRHILFTNQPPEVAAAIDAYLESLTPVPSPHRMNGGLPAAAMRGEKVFRSRETGCAPCHSGPLYTDLKAYDVGTAGRYDKPSDRFDTPTLIEIWRTAPYLHDGSAATLRDVLTVANRQDRHGRTSHLTADQLDDLCAFLLSL